MNLELRGVLENEGDIMKKIYKILLLLLFFVPAVVFADVAGPEFKTYNVEVKKSEINYYEYRGIESGNPAGTLEKGTKMTVHSQMKIKDEVWLGCEYNKKYFYVRATDVVAEGELSIKDRFVYDNDEPTKIKIKGEVILRKGPSPSYEESGRLEDVITEYTYYVLEPQYIYINYKGQKGWVAYDEVLYGGDSYITAEEMVTDCGRIPANTMFKDVWHNSPLGFDIELEYKGCTFEESTSNNTTLVRLPETQRKYKLLTEVDFFQNYQRTDYKTIKKGDEIIIYSADPYSSRNGALYYAEYNGKMGWIKINLYNDAEYLGQVNKPIKDVDDDDDDEEEDKKKSLDSDTLIIICVVVGVAVAVGAFAAIVYINNKGKKEEKIEKNS